MANRWQKALDDYNERQGKASPRYRSRLKEEERKKNKTVEKARERAKRDMERGYTKPR